MVFEALWLNFADVLWPVKAAIVSGYAVLIAHSAVSLARRRGPSFIELLLVIVSLVAFWEPVLAFFGRGSFVGLGEAILPLEIRVIITIAMLLPVGYLMLSSFTMRSLTRGGTRVEPAPAGPPRFAWPFSGLVAGFGKCRVVAKMTLRLDPYTGQARPDLPLVDSVGYFDSTEVDGLASGVYDLYASAPGYPETIIASDVQLRRWRRGPPAPLA